MSTEKPDIGAPAAALKNEFARQRWELFHRAIAHAKQTSNETTPEQDNAATETDCAAPVLSIVR